MLAGSPHKATRQEFSFTGQETEALRAECLGEGRPAEASPDGSTRDRVAFLSCRTGDSTLLMLQIGLHINSLPLQYSERFLGSLKTCGLIVAMGDFLKHCSGPGAITPVRCSQGVPLSGQRPPPVTPVWAVPDLSTRFALDVAGAGRPFRLALLSPTSALGSPEPCMGGRGTSPGWRECSLEQPEDGHPGLCSPSRPIAL